MPEPTDPGGQQHIEEEKMNEALSTLVRLLAQQAAREDLAKLNKTPASG